MEINKKPTRRVLLKVVTELQSEISQSIGELRNDRDNNSYEKGIKSLERALELCIDARSFDPPTDI